MSFIFCILYLVFHFWYFIFRLLNEYYSCNQRLRSQHSVFSSWKHFSKYSSSSSCFLPGPVLTSPKVSHCGDSVTLFCPLPPKQTPIYQSLSALSITHHASHCMESSHPKAEQRNLLFLQLQILGNSCINWCFILSHINLVAEKHNGGWIWVLSKRYRFVPHTML